MNPSEIIAEVAKLGVVLRVEGTNLVHRGPRGALRPELIAKLKAHKPAIVAELTSAEAPRALCPADVAERSAIIAEGDGCDRSEADERALGAHRFPSWSALADAQRAEILAELDRLPPSCERDGERLLEMTRAFLESSWFRQAVEKGWSMIELFGISPHAPVTWVGDWGFVVTLALLINAGTKIESVAEDGATFSTPSVARNKWPRFRPALRDCVLWWECRQIIAMDGGY